MNPTPQPRVTETSSPEEPSHPCGFVGQAGDPCAEKAPHPGGFCFWHDPHARKTGPEIKAQLEAFVHAGRTLEGFNLRGADLRGIHLTHHQRGKSVNLRAADLSRANLHGAHLFQIDLRGASLLKADLRSANLNYAQLDGANLLGADLRDARLEQVDWGRHLAQEYAARKMFDEGRPMEAYQLYGEAEETYRAISLAVQERGHSNLAGHFYQKQMVTSRMQMRRGTREWFLSKLVDLLCGYGERPDRVFAFSLMVILGCALVYFVGGVAGSGGRIGLDLNAGLVENLFTLLSCVYFSVITFMTVGYGDIVPTGWLRALAAAEAFLGAFSISLFVVVFVKRMTR